MSLYSIQVEKPDIIKFYAFTFESIDKPVVIEAFNVKQAREGLLKVIEKLPQKFQGKKVVGQTVTLPVMGVSKKKISGIDYVWVGKLNPTGWMPEQEYKLRKKKK
jgi:hypothetical protein